eukprot:gene47556-63758_t
MKHPGSGIKCDSIQYTPLSSTTPSTCVLTSGRASTSSVCTNVNTKTYDYDCLTYQPTVSPTSPPTYTGVCTWFPTSDCRAGEIISTSSPGMTLDVCK